MENITKFALRYNRVTILFVTIGILLGTWAAFTMPRQEDPTITIRSAQVNAYFPGMPTELIENLIAKPIERKLREIPEIKDINTTVSTGHVLLQPQLYDRYFDLAPIWQDLRNKMEEIKTDLPQGTQGPVVNDDFGRVAVATIALHGRGFSLKDLHDVSLKLKDQMGTLPGISKVELYGAQEERIYLEMNASIMSNYGITPGILTSSLTSQNIISSGGTIEVGNRALQLSPTGNFNSLEDIKNVQITSPETGLPVYLRDIATVKRDFAYPAKRPAFFNNRPAIILSLSMVAQFNIEAFGKTLTDFVQQAERDLPAGLQLDYATYQADLVAASVSSAMLNLVETIFIVLFVVIIFLGIRNGLIVGTIVPITIMFTLLTMEFLSIDLQSMSIAAIIIALGLLVDDGIIIAEDIAIRTKQGIKPYKAAIDSVKSLAYPSLISSLTTMLAFMPLAMSENTTGEYLSSLSYVIVIALFLSWLLSIFVTPLMCIYFVKTTPNKANKISAVEHLTEKLKIYYTRFLAFLVKFPLSFIVTMVIALCISIYALKFIPKQMLPYSDRNQYLIYVDLPAGNNIEATKESTFKLTSWLTNKTINPEIISNVAYVGFGGPRFVLSLSPPDAKDNVAFIVVNTKSSDDVAPLINRTNSFLNDELPEANATAKQMWMGGKEIGLLEYRITGPDSATLYDLAGQIETIVKSKPGAIGVTNNWQNPVVTMKIDIDQNRAQRANVSSQSIAESLSSYFDGYEVSDYRDGEYSIPITIRGDEQRNRLSQLRTLPVFTNDGNTVPLMQVADFRGEVNTSTIKRRNQERTITISLKHATLQATQFHKILLPEIESLKFPPQYRLSFGGEIESSGNANKALFAKLPYALMGMAILIVLQFNSLRRMAIIMLTIPLVMIGAILGLWLGKAYFSFTAILGMFSLAGIVINNGIILLDKADSECEAGHDVVTAMTNAARARLRPILMTTLTTIIGLIPMALFGGAMWYPMAIVIMFGLFVGTILTLGFVPILYILFNKQGTSNTKFNIE